MIGDLGTAELAIIVAAMLLGAITKGVIGTGLPTIAIPILAGSFGVEHAVVLMAVPTVVTNTWMLWEHRSFAGRTRDLPLLVLGGIPGVALGVWGLTALDERALAFALAGVVGVYLLISVTRPSFAIAPEVSRVVSGPVGLITGALQGATGISGPLMATYAHGLRLEPRAFLFTLTLQIQVFAVVQVVGLVAAGLYSSSRLLGSLVALVPIAVGLPLGIRLSYRIPPRLFHRIVLIAVAVMAVKIVFDALAGGA